MLSAHPHRTSLRSSTASGSERTRVAVVRERVPDPTIEELLSRRDEDFPIPDRRDSTERSNGPRMGTHKKGRPSRGGLTPVPRVRQRSRQGASLCDPSGAVMRTGMTRERSRARARDAHAQRRDPGAPPSARRAESGASRGGIEQTDALLQLSRTSPKVPMSGVHRRNREAEALKDGEILSKDASSDRGAARLQASSSRRSGAITTTNSRSSARPEQEVAGRPSDSEERDEFEQTARDERAREGTEALAKERAAPAKDCAALMKEREAHERDVERCPKARVGKRRAGDAGGALCHGVGAGNRSRPA